MATYAFKVVDIQSEVTMALDVGTFKDLETYLNEQGLLGYQVVGIIKTAIAWRIVLQKASTDP